MSETVFPATLLCDFYKVSHRAQYPENTEIVYSTWIPRESRVDGVTRVVTFGIQGFIQKYLVDYFNEHFFNRPLYAVLAEYTRFVENTLGERPAYTQHIEDLHQLGYLPLAIRALPEGTPVPIRVPMATIENTDPKFFWLTNYIETLFSCEVWQPSTAATIAYRYREILDEYAISTTGSTDGVEFQAHDFSIRGMTSLESAAKSGAAHLLSFRGTDNIPGIAYLEKYYYADIESELVGTSIPATEHSVMCAYGTDEFESFKRLITEVYPSGLVSIVSDTWDLWHVLGEVIPRLRSEIMARYGKIVIRPDSGDPADIICGDPSAPERSLARAGVVEALYQIFPGTVNELGFKVLDPHVGAIYGDSITLERAENICRRLMNKGFATTNIVLGVGSFTYQYLTRDTFGFALKSTWCQIDGVGTPIYKDPVTDTNHVKRSLKGRVVVVPTPDGKVLKAIDGLDLDQWKDRAFYDQLELVFRDGIVMQHDSLHEVRETLRSWSEE